MNTTDLLTVMGYCFGAFGVGFATGIFWTSVKRIFEKATGVGL